MVRGRRGVRLAGAEEGGGLATRRRLLLLLVGRDDGGQRRLPVLARPDRNLMDWMWIGAGETRTWTCSPFSHGDSLQETHRIVCANVS